MESSTPDEESFCSRLIALGIVDSDELDQMRERQRELEGGGEALHIGQVLIREKKLRPLDFLAIKQQMERESASGLLHSFRGREREEGEAARPTPSPIELGNRAVVWGPFRIDAELGRGGMGVVYRAEDRRRRETLALKILLPRSDQKSKRVARFERESKLLGHLQHPGIVRIYDTGVQDDYHYYTMDLIEGESLDRVLRRGPIDFERVSTIVSRVAYAIDHAHRSGVLHRDLKPANILIGTKGQPLLTDFGLGKALPDLEIMNEESSLTRPGTVLGTAFYLSPEQARGEIDRLDGRSDVYALGVVLYEMLTGGVPFRAASTQELFLKIMREPPTAPRTIRPEIPEALETVCLKALAKEPSDRFQTAAEMAQALERFHRAETPVGDDSLARQRLIGLVVLLCVILVLALLLYF